MTSELVRVDIIDLDGAVVSSVQDVAAEEIIDLRPLREEHGPVRAIFTHADGTRLQTAVLTHHMFVHRPLALA